LSKRKCGNVIYFEKKVHLENTFPKWGVGLGCHLIIGSLF
jgi:hypothetical protein